MAKKIISHRISDLSNGEPQSNEKVKDNHFLPISVWDLKKSKKYCELVNDSFNRDVDPNKSLSELNPDLIYRCLMLWSNEGDRVLDPFLNRGTTPIMSAYFNRIGYGNDIVPMYVDQVKSQVTRLIDRGDIWAKNVHLNNGNASDIINIAKNKFNVEQFEYIISSPPFWNLEPYESVDGQMSDIQNYDDFLKDYEDVIEKLHAILRGNHYVTYIVNDFVKEKKWYDFTGDTKNAFKKHGFSQQDIVINVIHSPFIIRAGLAFHNEKRTIKYHEYVLTFKKD